MARIQKLEAVTEVMCCPAKLYRMFTRDAPELPKYLPKAFHSVEVIGDGEVCLGTGFVWKAVPHGAGSAILTKQKITAVDNKNRSITYTVLEGDVMKDFNSFSFKLDIITPKSGTTDGTSLVKWSVEYEKANEDVVDPIEILKACEVATTEMNIHLLKKA
ncbi:hypothetical protein C5167_040603 [Papaver somniferum]|uniref:Bet v I/Major latex protein domain-containing protein n=1 Tax=Papaver somniferum TaxID=3469 RepID=A0A4Y7IIT7_PAPSO|nr:MLP-like protein 43 [Papaver somniferum]RZC47660.1 hypothetical protein C5167_040603 [Papaver somniferum]